MSLSMLYTQLCQVNPTVLTLSVNQFQSTVCDHRRNQAAKRVTKKKTRIRIKNNNSHWWVQQKQRKADW